MLLLYDALLPPPVNKIRHFHPGSIKMLLQHQILCSIKFKKQPFAYASLSKYLCACNAALAPSPAAMIICFSGTVVTSPAA
jgi:hypothetical protein